MSLFQTLSIGASGMGASSSTLNVIGDNIANIGTTGFKAGRASFADMIPEIRGGLVGPSVFGMGTHLQTVATQHTQGQLEDTANSLDVAITGQGFFQVIQQANQQVFYTRDGSFHVDKDHYITTSAGHRLQGYSVVDGQMTSVVDDIQLDLNPIDHKVTESITLDAVISAEADFSTTPYEVYQLAGSLNGDATAGAPTIAELSAIADFTTSVPVYDSLGRAHDVTVFMERVGPNDWNWSAVVDGGEADLDADGVADGTPGYALEIANGTCTFDGSGTLSAFTENAGATPWGWPGAAPFTFGFQVGLDTAGNATDGMLRMSGNTSAVSSIAQDGYRAANLLSLRVEGDGTVISTYENGEEIVLGQVAVATFKSEGGLQRVGGNMYMETGYSGDAALGVPGEGGRGRLTGYALEGSNVELEDEFVAMIQAQRSYQANTGVIRAANDTLQQLVNLV